MTDMLLIITPRSGWRREIQVFDLNGATEAEMFEAFESANDVYSKDRDSVNITIAYVSVGRLEAWLANHVEPNWWERLIGRYRVHVTRVVRTNHD